MEWCKSHFSLIWCEDLLNAALCGGSAFFQDAFSRSISSVAWVAPASPHAGYLQPGSVLSGQLVKAPLCGAVESLHSECSSFAQRQPQHRQGQLCLPLCCPSSYASSPRPRGCNCLFKPSPKGTMSYSLRLLLSDLAPMAFSISSPLPSTYSL